VKWTFESALLPRNRRPVLGSVRAHAQGDAAQARTAQRSENHPDISGYPGVAHLLDQKSRYLERWRRPGRNPAELRSRHK